LQLIGQRKLRFRLPVAAWTALGASLARLLFKRESRYSSRDAAYLAASCGPFPSLAAALLVAAKTGPQLDVQTKSVVFIVKLHCYLI